ncbi:MAG: alpha/beta hydrolase, partial [Pacificimonas sp.]
MKKVAYALAIVAAILFATFLIFRTPDIPAEQLRAEYANAESEFIEIEPGLSVHVRDEGPATAPALLLIHGSSSSLHTWEPWVERLKADYRIISYDQPGHGLTGPHPRGCYTADCMVAVADAVAGVKGLTGFVIGGNSMGGGVSWNYARAHGEKLAAMVLVDASGIDVPRDDDGVPIGFRIMQTPVVSRIATQITPRSMVEA